MRYLLDSWSSKTIGGPESAARSPLGYGPVERDATAIEIELVTNDSLFQR
jgi:hypothetical protein